MKVLDARTFVQAVGDDFPAAFESMSESLKRFGVPIAQIDHGMISVRRTFDHLHGKWNYSLVAHAEVSI